MGIKPTDLPGFGTVPGNFVETDGKLIVPKEVNRDSPIEELETPDQLPERTDVPKVVITETEEPQADEPEKKSGPDLDRMHSLHPDWEPNPEFQINMFNDLLKLNEDEHNAVKRKMDSIEIFLENYPLMASIAELQEMRRLIKRNYELTGERSVLIENLVIRQQEIAKENQPEVDNTEKNEVPLPTVKTKKTRRSRRRRR